MASKVVALVVVAVVAVAAIAGAAIFILGNQGEKPQAITDCAGNEIKFDSVPTRIASMNALSTEIICELGLIDNLVAVQSDAGVFDVTDFIYGIDIDINYPAELKKRIADGTIKQVAKTTGWTFDQVMTANPDLVVFNKNTSNLKVMAQLQEAGVTCLVTHDTGSDFTSLDPIYNNMDMLGKAFGKTSISDNYNKQMKETVKKITDKCSTYTKGKSVEFLSYWEGNHTLYAYGEKNMKTATARELGCKQVMGEGKGSMAVTIENVLEVDPDVLIVGPASSTDNMQSIKTTLSADPLWSELKAVKNNHVYFIEYNANQSLSYWTHHYIHGIALIAAIIFDEMGVNVPSVVTNADYLNYIKWVKDL